MFNQLKNINTAFQYIRYFTFILILACTCIVCYTVYTFDHRLEEAEDKTLILLNGKVIQAVASSRKENIQVEAKDHIKTFHEHFFNLSPDDKAIEATMLMALYLADASAKKQYDDLREGGYYSNIISGNVSQELIIDSIQLNTDQSPYYFRFFGKQKLVRPSSTILRALVTEGYLRNVLRSTNNPHGFLIEKWRVLNNRDIQQNNR